MNSSKVKPSEKNSFLSEIEEIPAVLQQKYLPSLDGFRAISIILVITSHFHFDKPIWIDGSLGVKIFFVISGFLITTLLLKEKIVTKTISLKNFYLRRAFRILPLVMLFLAILSIINIVFNLHIPLIEFLMVIFFVRNLTLIPNNWYTAHFWSLSIEEQYYIFSPFLLKFSTKLFTIVLISILCCIPIFHYLQFHGNLFKANFALNIIYELISQTDGIAMGSLFSILIFRYNHAIEALIKKRQWIMLLGIFLIWVIYFDKVSFLPVMFKGVITSAIIGLLIVINIYPRKDWIFSLLNNRFIKFIGVLSYSLYIWQQLFTDKQPWQNSFPNGSNAVINIILLFIVSCLSYFLFEKKFLNLKAKFKILK